MTISSIRVTGRKYKHMRRHRSVAGADRSRALRVLSQRAIPPAERTTAGPSCVRYMRWLKRMRANAEVVQTDAHEAHVRVHT